MRGAISSVNRVLEDAIAVRTYNTQIQRLSENLENLEMIQKYSDDCKLMCAIDDSIKKYDLEMIENLNKMYACLVDLKSMVDLGMKEITEMKSDVELDLEEKENYFYIKYITN